MIKSYNRTLFNPVLTEAKFILYFTDAPKHEVAELDEETKIEYTGVKQWDIVSGDDAEEIENDSDLIDELHEYLVLHFEDGRTATFRNTHTVMFVW